ncbi:MAG: NAD(+)/NADH kinase [Lachnospiraceae bacterium]|nr:NAD(+)/NADH kinase [Lachnospiraceae bacterium]MCD7766871.1 NAD(+)/NADH kinase [Lachnospiraceae bacterium]
MNVFYVISNELKDPGQETARFIRSYIEERGGTCFLRGGHTAGVSEVESPSAQQYRYTDARQIPGETQCVLVLGGDGTLLQAARDLVECSIPLLGVNMGTLGYLAEIEKKNITEALEALLKDKFSIEERMMLSGTALHQNRKLMQDIALNDIVITRSGRMRVVDFNIYVDGVFLNAYSADGIIVSTPTGSTGYSLSAGGPIVAPSASLLLLTAIAPHTLNSRPIVLPGTAEVVIEVASGHVTDIDGAEATFDGDTSVKLNVGDRVVISQAEQKTKLVKMKNTGFLEILREKMNK